MNAVTDAGTGTQFREWSPDARQLTSEQRTQVAGGCMVNIKTELSDGRVVYKQCGKPSKSTPCNAHNKEPQAFLASLHPMHPAQPCSPYTNHNEWEFFQEIDAKAMHRPIDTFVRAAATIMVLLCLWALAGSLSPTFGSASPIAFPNAWYASGVSGAHSLPCDATDPSGTDEFAPTATFTDEFANVWNAPTQLDMADAFLCTPLAS